MLLKLSQLLTVQRLRYPYFIGGALWFSWFISLVLGPGNLDLAGHLIGTDFVAFYTAGRILVMDRSSDLYDLELAKSIQQPLYGGDSDNFNPYLNPPFYAWIFVPFAMIQYPWSPILWMALNLVLLLLSLNILNVKPIWKLFLLVLTWQPAFAAISFGQNAFLTLFILTAVYGLWKKDKLFLAGLLAGLLAYKPQLLIGLGILWLLEHRRNWSAILGSGITAGILGLLSFLFLPEATIRYIQYGRQVASNLMTVEGFPIWNSHGVQSFWLGLLPKQTMLSFILYMACAIAGLIVFLKFWNQHRSSPDLTFAGAVCLTIWVTPYIMVYDWILLIIPIVILWQGLPGKHKELMVVISLFWVVLFFSSVLTFVQMNFFGRSVQISIPAFVILIGLLIRLIQTAEVNQMGPVGGQR